GVERQARLDELTAAALEKFAEQYDESQIKEAIETIFLKAVRSMIIEKKKRPDGRAMDEVRELGIEVGVLPRVHGTGLFNRGETQALTIATLAGPSQE